MDIIIVGAGAAGLVAGIEAAKNGANVTILEKNEKPGKKILASGNGRCNLTNVDQSKDAYRGENPDFAWNIINQFGHFDAMQFFTKIGVYTKNKNGYIYPYSEQAASVLEILLKEAEYLKIKIKTLEEVVKIKPLDEGFEVISKTWTYQGDKVIITAGSMASPQLGGSDSGYALAQALGQPLIKPLPALVALEGVGEYFARWSGVRMEGKVTLLVDNVPEVSSEGEIQFTDYGVSGIPIFDISRFATRAIDDGSQVIVVLDLMPDFTEEFLIGLLESRIENCPYKNLQESLVGLIPKKMIPIVANTDKTLREVATWIKCYPVLVKRAHSLLQAQVCSGGVDTKELNPQTLESKLVPGLYFAGEIVDVDGKCGGYNLQWAWSSGTIAGKNASQGEK